MTATTNTVLTVGDSGETHLVLSEIEGKLR